MPSIRRDPGGDGGARRSAPFARVNAGADPASLGLGQETCLPRPDVDTAFAGVAYRLEERARDGKFQVCPDVRTRAPADANADLVLTFTPPAIKDSAAATAEQEAAARPARTRRAGGQGGRSPQCEGD